MRIAETIAAALLLASLTGPAGAEIVGYSVQSDGNDWLYEIDLNTGAATPVGPVRFLDVEGLCFQPGTGTLFGWNNGGHLITIDLATGMGTTVGPSGVSGQFDAGLTFDAGGDLFASMATAEELYSVDPLTGLASLIGPTTRQDVVALVDAGGDTLWGVSQDYDGQPLNFVSVSKSTGATTVIGPMGLGSGITAGVGIDYGPDGTLWGIADNGVIFTIDTTTGQATVVATTLGGFEGLAIPEPATVALLALGGQGILRRRRKRREC
jgi:hypothetical protein